MTPQPATRTPTLGESLDHYGEAYCTHAVNCHEDFKSATEKVVHVLRTGLFLDSHDFDVMAELLETVLEKAQEVKP